MLQIAVRKGKISRKNEKNSQERSEGNIERSGWVGSEFEGPEKVALGLERLGKEGDGQEESGVGHDWSGRGGGGWRSGWAGGNVSKSSSPEPKPS